MHAAGPERKTLFLRHRMASQARNSYEVVYDVGLLDDIHNFFPALLYDHGRFNTLPQVFSYIRHQMNTRFNLYSYGAGLAADRTASEHTSQTIPTVILTPQMNPLSAPFTSMRSSQTVPRTDRTATVETTSEILTNMQSANLLLSLLGLGSDQAPPLTQTTTRRWASFRDPVIVRPTREQIAAATEVLEGRVVTEGTTCVICQDSIQTTDTARKITHCSHTFHQACIDQWFLRNVHCPTCRHDIREQLGSA